MKKQLIRKGKSVLLREDLRVFEYPDNGDVKIHDFKTTAEVEEFLSRKCSNCGKDIKEGYDIYAYETNNDQLCQDCFCGKHECSPTEYRRDTEIAGYIF